MILNRKEPLPQNCTHTSGSLSSRIFMLYTELYTKRSHTVSHGSLKSQQKIYLLGLMSSCSTTLLGDTFTCCHFSISQVFTVPYHLANNKFVHCHISPHIENFKAYNLTFAARNMKPSDVLRATYSEWAILCFVAFLGYVSTLLYVKVEPYNKC